MTEQSIGTMLDNRVVPICCWQKIRNNGDAITAFIIDQVLGGCPTQGSGERQHLLATGSIFFMATSKSLVWGSGVLNKGAYLPELQPKQIRAVRGHLSADFLVEKNIHIGDIPFGDPGILVNRLTGITQSTGGGARRIAVVPHHDDIGHPFYQQAARRDDVIIVNMLDDSLKPVQQIADADIVISQSLHGLVYAESFNKPSVWLSHRSDDIWTFKFQDWNSTLYNPQIRPSPMSLTIDELAKQAERRYSSIDIERLLAAFPVEVTTDSGRPTFTYDRCRSNNPFRVVVVPALTSPSVDAEPEDLTRLFLVSLNTVFRGWAERTYSILMLGGADAIPSPEQTAIILEELDKRAHVDHAIIVKNQEFAQPNIRILDFAHGVRIYGGLAGQGKTYVLRPSFERLTDNFITFGI